MNITLKKIEKLEESLLDDKQIKTIIGARRLYRKWIKTQPRAEVLQNITKNFPEVPHILLTARLSGRLLEAEAKAEQQHQAALNWDVPTAEKTIRRLIANSKPRIPDVPMDELIDYLQTFPEFAGKVDFDQLKQEYL